MPWRYLFIWIGFLLFFVSCKKNSDDEARPTITLNQTELNFTSVANPPASFVIQSNIPWLIDIPVNAGWVSVDRDSGLAGSTTVIITIQDNPLNTSRTAVLTIRGQNNNTASATLTIRQTNGLKIISVTSTTSAGGDIALINGYGFSAVPSENAVSFNNHAAVVQSATNQQLSVIIPQGCGSGKVIVSSNNLADTSDFDFIYKWVGVVTLVAGSTQGYQDGNALTAKFFNPDGLDFDNAGNLYVADYNNKKIRKITPAGIVSTLPGRIATPNLPFIPLTDYDFPTGLIIDGNDNIYVTEHLGHIITKISPTGTITVVAGGSEGFTNGNGTNASFRRPVDLTVDAAGNLYVSDFENYAIRKITPAGDVTTFAGGVMGYQNGTGTNALFNKPAGITTDASGNMYICDRHNNRIRKLTVAGTVTTIAGTGTEANVDGDALTVAQFKQPWDIAAAPDGRIIISNSDNNNQIRILLPNGKVESIYSFVDSVTSNPVVPVSILSLTVDVNNIIYFSDLGGHKIYKMTYK